MTFKHLFWVIIIFILGYSLYNYFSHNNEDNEAELPEFDAKKLISLFANSYALNKLIEQQKTAFFNCSLIIKTLLFLIYSFPLYFYMNGHSSFSLEVIIDYVSFTNFLYLVVHIIIIGKIKPLENYISYLDSKINELLVKPYPNLDQLIEINQLQIQEQQKLLNNR